MQKTNHNQAINNRTTKISLLFLLLILLLSGFLFSVFKTITSTRQIPSHHAIKHDRSLRGSIISADGYTLSSSEKTYEASVRGESIDPDKRALFVKLFSIYSGIAENTINQIFKERRYKGHIILSKTLDTRDAMQLKSLAYKLKKLDVFRSIKNKNGIEVLYSLDITENGEHRRFPLVDVLTPILGYTRDKMEDGYNRPVGQKGLEQSYEKHITSKKDGYFKGKRDVLGRIIHDRNSIKLERVDGLDLHLNIPLGVQRRVELMIDEMKQNIDAEEIIVGIMESHTGKLLSLATTQRYNPSVIRQNDINALQPKFTEYPYEVGSVMKPISLSIALEHNKVTPNTVLNTFNGKLQIGKHHWIRDDEEFESLSATDIIVHSSNVGISQIAWMLTGDEFRQGLLKFGIAQPSGIDLLRDLPGQLKPAHLLNHQLHRANTSYGYGMMVTFAQLIKAYSAFNNDGVAVTPRIIDYLEDVQEHHYTLDPIVPDLTPISPKTAEQIKTILKEVVSRGTGIKGQFPGLEIGGKTGTAHIAQNGHYTKEYHSSFYGFANDEQGHKYTLGALVIRAKKPYAYFASNSAVPTFKKMVEILVELDYLKPTKSEEITDTKQNKPTLEPVVIQEKPIVVPNEAIQESKKVAPQPTTVKELFKIKTPPPRKTPLRSTPIKPIMVQPKIEKIPPKPAPKVKSFEELF